VSLLLNGRLENFKVQQPTRFSSFYNRVDFERAVLRATNAAFGATSVLHGLTPDARAVWLKTLPPRLETSILANLLERCWEELGRMSDHSRNVFEIRPDRPDVRMSLLNEIRALSGVTV
jgi:hypothetical protein